MSFKLVSSPSDVGTAVYVYTEPVAIVAAARTGIGRRGGPLSRYSAVQLGAQAVGAAVARSGVAKERFARLVMGNVVSAGLGEAPAKQVAIEAHLRAQTWAKTVNVVCGSGMEAIVDTALAIERGVIDVGIAGGMESATHAPYLLGPFDREHTYVASKVIGYRMADVVDDLPEKIRRRRVLLKEATRYDGLFWPPENKFMAQYAAATMKQAGLTVDRVNEWASYSYERARRAVAQGAFFEEVCTPEPDQVITAQEEQELLGAEEDQPVSAYNSAAPADAGAALVLAGEEVVKKEGSRPLAWIVGHAVGACAPRHFVEAPLHVSQALLGAVRQAGNDQPLNFVEINEAFAMQLGLFEAYYPAARVNVNGGAIALGHPLGAGGTRIVVTLVHALQKENGGLGLATICYGGGGAYSLIVRTP